MKLLTTVAIALLPFVVVAQKTVLSLPFEFEKKLLASSDYDAYFLDNRSDSIVSIILKDNRKVQYVQLDKNFKVLSKIDMDIDATVFKEDISDYRGGTARGNLFNFIYEEKEKKSFSRQVTIFQQETVDYKTKTIKHSSLFEIPRAETVVSSFSDNNNFYTITADDKAKELVFYIVNETGSLKQQRLPFTVPDNAGKNRDKLSEYLNGLRVFKSNEEPDLSSAVSPAKLFCEPGSLALVINETGHPVHLVTIQLSDFKTKENFINLDEFKKEEKEKIYINSFRKGTELFSLIVNKKGIQVAVHNAVTGKLITKQEINEESDFGIFAQPPVAEAHMGKTSDQRDVNDMKRLLKQFNRGTEGIMVTRNEKGQYIVTIGTYDLVTLRTGGSSGGYTGGYTPSSMAVTPGITNHGATRSGVMTYDPHKYYRPGAPALSSTNALYYTSTYFRLLLDGTAYKQVKGKAPMPAADQIKEYLRGSNLKAKATNQFAIGAKQYYGYYDKDAKSYVIEEIRLR